MARISTYAIDPNLTPEDKLHGSDENNVTRNFNMGPGGPGGPGGDYYYNNVVTYITECDSRALAFLYHTNTFDSNPTPQPGAIVANTESSNANTIQFSTINHFLVSKLPYAASIAAATTNTCENIMSEYVGEKIIWYDIYNPNNYGIYSCTGWSVDGAYPNHYNMDLTHISSNGSLQYAPTTLLYIIEIWGGSDKTYTHNQTTLSNTWVVNHNLGKFVSVQIENGTDLAHANITHNSNNQLTITFSADYIGKAYCN